MQGSYKQAPMPSRSFAEERASDMIVTLGDVLNWAEEDEPCILGEFISRGSTGMVAGPRGLGKTNFTLNFGYAIAAGKLLEPWGIGAGVPVVYLDGEMRRKTLKKRLKQIANRDPNEGTKARAQNNLHIISRAHVKGVIGYIDIEADQKLIEAQLPHDCALLIIDNLSAWTSSSREDAASYGPIKTWLTHLRARDIAVLLVHHASKQGVQRGTSIREDLLDYSILLSKDRQPSPRNGTSFIVTHTKVRELLPDIPENCRVVITTENDVMHMRCEDEASSSAEDRDAEIAMHLAAGLKGKQIAELMDIHPSTVTRAKQRILSKPGEQGAEESGDEN